MVTAWRCSLLCTFLCCFVSTAEPLRVAVAANFAPHAEQLASTFHRQRGQTIALAVGASGALYAQIVHGAPFDVFLSADSIRPLRLEQQGMTLAGSRQTYFVGQLAIWSTNDLPSDMTPVTLRNWLTNGEPLVIANPKFAPYGVAAQQVLQRVGVQELNQSVTLITANNVMQAMQFIASGNASRGLVARHLINDKSQSLPLPADYYAPIEQQLVILKRTQRPLLAAEFAAYVRSSTTHSLLGLRDGSGDGQP